jgi:AcrR family transcriptional regulator
MPRVKTLSKKQSILEAASRVFSEREFHEALIDDVAAQAGVGKGTIYRYFTTKEDLYFATLLYGLDGLSQALASTLPREASPVRRLERIAREILQFFWYRRELLSLIHADERRFAQREGGLQKRREAVQRLVQQAILDGIELGEFRGIDTRIGAELFRGMIRAASCFRTEDDSIDELVPQIVGIFTHGIAKQRA